METLLAALCVFLLMGLFGAFAFTPIDLTFPGSFRASNGPGLVWADERSRATGFARNAASLEAMTRPIFLAVVVARLVGLRVAPPRETAGP